MVPALQGNRDGGWKSGGEGQNRTVDTTIFSRMLYQLSYLATCWTSKSVSG